MIFEYAEEYEIERERLESQVAALLAALEDLLAQAIPNYDMGADLRQKIGLPPSDLEPVVLRARAAIAAARNDHE